MAFFVSQQPKKTDPLPKRGFVIVFDPDGEIKFNLKKIGEMSIYDMVMGLGVLEKHYAKLLVKQYTAETGDKEIDELKFDFWLQSQKTL